MTPWLVDASVLLAAEDADDDNHDAAVELLEAAHPLLTLDLAFYEVSNVAIRAWHDQEAAGRLRSMVAAIADDGGVIRAEPSLLERAERIAANHGIAVYDASYVAAADVASARLVSCDLPRPRLPRPRRPPGGPPHGHGDRPVVATGLELDSTGGFTMTDARFQPPGTSRRGL